MVMAFLLLVTLSLLQCFVFAAYDRSLPTYILVVSGIDGLANPNIVFSNDRIYIGTPPDNSETLYAHLDDSKLSFVKYTESIMGVQYAYIEKTGILGFTPARSETEGDSGFSEYGGFLLLGRRNSWCARRMKDKGLYRVEWRTTMLDFSCTDIQIRLVEVRGRGRFRNQALKR